MSAAIARSERLLNRLQTRVGISDCGKDWLVAAVDPMHDLKLLHLEGFPDTNLSDSCVQKVPVSFTISAPPNLAANTNWTCMVYNNPWIESYNTSTQFAGYNFPTPAGQVIDLSNPGSLLTGTLGGITVLCAPDTDANPFAFGNFTSAGAGTGHTMTSHSVPGSYLVGKERIVASGVEIHNTTAEINRQGTTTVFRQTVPDYEVSSVRTFYNANNPDGIIFTPASVVSVPAPPVNIASAMLLPGSRQWEALEGSYQAHVLHSSEIPTEDTDYIVPVYYDSLGRTTFVGPGGTPFPIGNALTAPSIAAFPEFTWTKFDMSGTIFSGLSSSSTLTVTWNVYIERFPDSSLADLVVLATPSPSYDPRAIEAYSLMVLDMPVGVMAKENGLGDWFSGAISKVSEWVAPVANFAGNAVGMINHPYAQAASAGLKTVGGIASSLASRNDQVAPPNAWVTNKGVEKTARALNNAENKVRETANKVTSKLKEIASKVKGKKKK